VWVHPVRKRKRKKRNGKKLSGAAKCVEEGDVRNGRALEDHSSTMEEEEKHQNVRVEKREGRKRFVAVSGIGDDRHLRAGCHRQKTWGTNGKTNPEVPPDREKP